MLERARSKPRIKDLLRFGLACAALSGCILEDPRGSGVVVLDREAVASGVTLEQHAASHTAAALPLLVDSDAEVSVHNRYARQRLLLAPGELVQLRGERLTPVRYALGRDVDGNRLALTAPRESADEVAAQVSAELSELEPGVFELRVANAFVHVAQLTESELEVAEVAPLALAGASGAAPSGVQTAGFALRDLDDAASGALPAAPLALQAGPDPVGVYRCDEGALVLDAAGRFSGCIAGWGDRQGSYRIQGHVLTLDARGGQRVLELGDNASLRGAGGLSCELAGTGGAR